MQGRGKLSLAFTKTTVSPLPLHSTALAKLIGLVPCRGFSVSAGDGLLQTPSPSRHTALPFSHHSSLPGFCSRKAKVPGCSSVSAITVFQLFPPSHFQMFNLKGKCFILGQIPPSSPFSLSSPSSPPFPFSLEEEQSHSNQEAEELHVYFPLGPQSLLVWHDLIEV